MDRELVWKAMGKARLVFGYKYQEKRQSTTPTQRALITSYRREFFCCPAFNLFCKNHVESKCPSTGFRQKLMKLKFTYLTPQSLLSKVADRSSFSTQINFKFRSWQCCPTDGAFEQQQQQKENLAELCELRTAKF